MVVDSLKISSWVLDYATFGTWTLPKRIGEIHERHMRQLVSKRKNKTDVQQRKINFLYWYYTGFHPGGSLSMSSISDWQLTQDVSGGALTSSCADALPQKGRNLILGFFPDRGCYLLPTGTCNVLFQVIPGCQ